jgi:hypothetical protein
MPRQWTQATTVPTTIWRRPDGPMRVYEAAAARNPKSDHGRLRVLGDGN